MKRKKYKIPTFFNPQITIYYYDQESAQENMINTPAQI